MNPLNALKRWWANRSHPSDPNTARLFGGFSETSTGLHVDPNVALALPPVFGCTKVLSETESCLPLNLYKRRSDGGRDEATNHSLYPILKYSPNPEMTSMKFREAMMIAMCLRGNAYAEIEWTHGGQVKALWPLRADKMRVKRVNRELVYLYDLPNGPIAQLPAYRVLHIRAFGDALMGFNPVEWGAETMGLSLAAEQFAGKFFKNGATPSLIFSHPGELGDGAYNRLLKSIESFMSGLTNAHRIAILEEGMSAKAVGISPEAAQILSTRRFQKHEICGMYRVPPHMIADLERATFNNIEHLSMSFISFSMLPWFVRIESQIAHSLLSTAEQRNYFCKHVVDAVLRGDTKTRYESYAIGRNWGWLSANDVRKKEDMNPIEGGDTYLNPLNMIPSTETRLGIPNYQNRFNPTPTPTKIAYSARQAAGKRQKLAQNQINVFEGRFKSIINDEIKAIRTALDNLRQRDSSDFSLWLSEFYEGHKELWLQKTLPLFRAYAQTMGLAIEKELNGDYPLDAIAQFFEQYVESFANRQANESFIQLIALLRQAIDEESDPVPLIEKRLDGWEATRSEQLAHNEAFRAGNAIAKAFFIAAGVTRLRWIATGDNCPYCSSLDGKVVGIETNFLAKNTDFNPDGADRPINVRSNIGHPPLHKKCDCMISAEV